MELSETSDRTLDTVSLTWYAMRATYRREIIVRNLLGQQGIRTFIPMRYALTTRGGRKRRELIPAIHNLVFVQTDAETMKQVKSKISYLQYMMDRTENRPITIPEKQMEDFIRVSSCYDEPVEYITADTSRMIKGTRVRINGGAFDGVEGTLARTARSKSRKVIVSVNGVIAAVTAEIRPDMIEIIEPE